MKAIVVEPFKKGYVKDIEGGLESLQKEVDGYIEVVYPFEDMVALVCDEEGKLKGKQPNRAMWTGDGQVQDIICGKFLVLGLGEEDFTDVPEELMQKYLDIYEPHDEFLKLGRKIYISTYKDNGKCLKFMEEIV